MIKMKTENKKILNVGCGTDTYGTHFVDKFPSRPDVLKCDLDWEKLPFPSNHFDEIRCYTVLEHLTNLGFVFKEMYRVLNKNGKLVLITDNAHFWTLTFHKDHALKYNGLKSRIGLSEEDRHYVVFELSHLRNLAIMAGFRNIHTNYTSGVYSKRSFRSVAETLSTAFLRVISKRLAYRHVRLDAIK